MKVRIRLRGVFCESGGNAGLVQIKGFVAAKERGFFTATLYSTLKSFEGLEDVTPITLAVGDLLHVPGSFQLNLPPGGIIEIGGNILGPFRSFTIASDELINLPKTFHFRFTDGSQSVRTEIEVEKVNVVPSTPEKV